MTTPSVTPVQALGAALMALMFATWPVLEAFGHGLTSTQTIAITGFVTAFVAVAVAADAVIRHGRAKVAAAAVANSVKLPIKTPVTKKK